MEHFDLTVNSVVPVPQIRGIINSIAPTAALSSLITTYFTLSATVSCAIFAATFLRNQNNYFQDLKQHFFSLDCCFDLGFGGFPNIGRHQQICLQEVAADVGSYEESVKPEEVWLAHPACLLTLQAGCVGCGLSDYLALLTFRPRPGPQQVFISFVFASHSVTPEFLFHVNGLEAGPHSFRKSLLILHLKWRSVEME